MKPFGISQAFLQQILTKRPLVSVALHRVPREHAFLPRSLSKGPFQTHAAWSLCSRKILCILFMPFSSTPSTSYSLAGGAGVICPFAQLGPCATVPYCINKPVTRLFPGQYWVFWKIQGSQQPQGVC